MNFITEMEKIIADFYDSTDEIIKKAKSTGKECICTKDTIKASCPIHGINGINGKENSTRPTLQPIEKLKIRERNWSDLGLTIPDNDFIKFKINELIDRINLLSIKNKI